MRLRLRRHPYVALFAVALIVYGLESLAWPMHAGRDAANYLHYYLATWDHAPYPALMAYRTPGAPFFFGPLLQVGGSVLVEVAMALGFAGAVTAIARATTLALGQRLGLAAGAIVMVYPSFGALLHQLSSDSLSAIAVSLWLLAAVETARAPTVSRFALQGAAVAALVLIRPSNQVLLLFAVLPFLLSSSWRLRVARSGAFVAVAALALVAWSSYNLTRYDDFTVSRSVTAQMPLNRAFYVDRIVSPSNGPRSRELARIVKRELLTKEPYRSYGITLEQYFNSKSTLMYWDLIPLSDRVWGWDDDYKHLRSVGFEAVRSHPVTYAEGVARSVAHELVNPWKVAAPQVRSQRVAETPAPLVTINGRRLPQPTEGQPIPGQHLWWLYTTPDGRISMDWSDVAHPALKFRDAEDRRAAARIDRRVDDWMGELPNRAGNERLADLLNRLSTILPSMAIWLLLALFAVPAARYPELRALLLTAALGLLVVVATALGQPTSIAYALAFQPVFIAAGFAGLVSVARFLRPRVAARAPQVR